MEWTPISTPPTATNDYLVGWWEQDEDGPFPIHLVAGYSLPLGGWDGPSHHYQFWAELPSLPPRPTC